MATAQPLSNHEETISSFYGTFPFPWRPSYFDAVDDPMFHTTLLRQETGRRELEHFDRIWVAGCGTNQALMIALQFPNSVVLGTDVAAQSLDICHQNASQLGVTNLRLEQQGIMQSNHVRKFDLIVCTGVIHHNPDPRSCLQRLSAALRDDGVLELMVYNKYHRCETSAFQAAYRVLLSDDGYDYDRKYDLARRLAYSLRSDSLLSAALRQATDDPEQLWADSWMNPCEKSYNVDELWELAQACELIVEAPRLNPYDRVSNRFLWTLELPDGPLREKYFALDDRQRWQLVNLLDFNRSPLLWFYMRPDRDGSVRRVTEVERNEIFMESILERPTALRRRWLVDGDGNYSLSDETIAIDSLPTRPEVRDVWSEVDGRRTVREIFSHLGRSDDFNSIYKARLMLSTSEYPHVILRPPT